MIIEFSELKRERNLKAKQKIENRSLRTRKRSNSRKKERIIEKLTFNAELKTTTSPGGCIHGSPSTCTGISECEWILMWPPCAPLKS